MVVWLYDLFDEVVPNICSVWEALHVINACTHTHTLSLFPSLPPSLPPPSLPLPLPPSLPPSLPHTQPGDVDLVCASFETAVGSTGGFCAGKSYVVDHQRLSGLGYCFSASTPPMLVAASIKSLDLMEGSPDMFSHLREKAGKMRRLLQG